MSAERPWMVRMVGVDAGMMHSYPLLKGYDASKVVVELCSGQTSSIMKWSVLLELRMGEDNC